MEPVSDYYTILGVASTASVDEIKRAHRRLARTYHPDRNGGNPVYVERMKSINAARDLLSDPMQRAAYDARRFEEARPKAAPPRPAYDGPVYDSQRAESEREQRRRQRERETAAWEAGTYRFGGQSPYTRRSAAHAYARDRENFRFGSRQRAGAGWAGCAAALIGCAVLLCLGVGGILTARSVPDANESLPTTINRPAPDDQSSEDSTHQDLCQAFSLYSSVLLAAATPDGKTVVVTTMPDTNLSGRIDVAWKIDAYMDSRLHQNIDDHLTSIRVVSSQGTDLPVILLPGRESWGIEMPEKR